MLEPATPTVTGQHARLIENRTPVVPTFRTSRSALVFHKQSKEKPYEHRMAIGAWIHRARVALNLLERMSAR
jgi:hypothetical protein